MVIEKNATVLFQGDSITNWGRDVDTDDLGYGYPKFVSGLFKSMYPHLDVTFINKGVNGNRARDLQERWTEDCIDIKPDILSVLIGINDTWRRYDSDDETSADDYYDSFSDVLTRTKLEVGDIPIIILEPFLVPHPEEIQFWREDLDPKIQMARRLAREFEAIYIPLDGIFSANSINVVPSYWSEDGVHPSEAGHALIARAWLEAVL